MLRKLVMALSLFGFGAQAAVHIETDLQTPTQSFKDATIIELSDRATLTVGDHDLHISVITSKSDESKMVIVLDIDVRDAEGVVTNQGSASVETEWGASATFILAVSEDEEKTPVVTLTVVATQVATQS